MRRVSARRSCFLSSSAMTRSMSEFSDVWTAIWLVPLSVGEFRQELHYLVAIPQGHDVRLCDDRARQLPCLDSLPHGLLGAKPKQEHQLKGVDEPTRCLLTEGFRGEGLCGHASPFCRMVGRQYSRPTEAMASQPSTRRWRTGRSASSLLALVLLVGGDVVPPAHRARVFDPETSDLCGQLVVRERAQLVLVLLQLGVVVVVAVVDR